jgi:hypothetical protein
MIVTVGVGRPSGHLPDTADLPRLAAALAAAGHRLVATWSRPCLALRSGLPALRFPPFDFECRRTISVFRRRRLTERRTITAIGTALNIAIGTVRAQTWRQQPRSVGRAPCDTQVLMYGARLGVPMRRPSARWLGARAAPIGCPTPGRSTYGCVRAEPGPAGIVTTRGRHLCGNPTEATAKRDRSTASAGPPSPTDEVGLRLRAFKKTDAAFGRPDCLNCAIASVVVPRN